MQTEWGVQNVPITKNTVFPVSILLKILVQYVKICSKDLM